MTVCRRLTIGLFGLALLGLAACSPQIDLIRSGPAPRLFEITAPDGGAVSGGRLGAALFVAAPTTGGALDSERIAIRLSDNEMSYLRGARWSSRLPAMLGRAVFAGLEDAAPTAGLFDSPGAAAADYTLDLDIRHFEAITDSAGGPAVRVRVSLRARLTGRGAAAKVVATTLSATGKAPSASAADVVPALDATFHKAFADLLRWLTSQTGS